MIRARRMSLLVTLALLAALLVVNLMIDPPDDGHGGSPLGTTQANIALMTAVEMHDIAGIRRALADGAELNVVDSFGWSALTRAASAGNLAICSELLSCGASPDGGDEGDLPPLISACLHGNYPTVELLLRYGADLNARTRGGGTALNIAASAGQLDIACALIRAGADVNAADDHGWTPLMGAVSQSESTAVVEALLRAGAHPDLRDDEGNTAVQIAARDNNLRVVELLLRRRRQESYGRTLLGMAVPDALILRRDG